ncbi:uncharacterized protein LOC131857590 [Cryptomeria japonica]|uniref:uncharacterized protein LOC131857590 n=1 Tax=Cryptomeria japonica TaxID=3369 RepID=UPI0027DA0ACF|nr:uncharacterized protein LOC131857590 [Cryptomeria japonica]
MKEKESQRIDDQSMKEKSEECERLFRDNIFQKNEMEASVKPISSPKPQAKPSIEGKRKRGKARVFISTDEEETESDEEETESDEEETESDEGVKEVKKISKATKVAKEKPSSEPKSHKKSKTSKHDVALKKGKIEVKPPISLDQIVNEVVKNVISKVEIERLLKLTKNEFRSKYKVNKIMFGKIDEVAKENKKILSKVLLENQYEVNQIVEKIEVSMQEVVRFEDERKEDEGKDKDDNPLVDADNPLVLEKKENIEMNVEKGKVEVKVETLARGTKELVKGK